MGDSDEGAVSIEALQLVGARARHQSRQARAASPVAPIHARHTERTGQRHQPGRRMTCNHRGRGRHW